MPAKENLRLAFGFSQSHPVFQRHAKVAFGGVHHTWTCHLLAISWRKKRLNGMQRRRNIIFNLQGYRCSLLMSMAVLVRSAAHWIQVKLMGVATV